MKVTVLKDDLVEALDRVRWTVAESKMIQLHQCFCFRQGTVAAYNGIAGTVTNIDLGDADFAVPADKFFRLISSLFDTIEFDFKKNGTLVLTSGQNETSVQTIPTKSFPMFKPADMPLFCSAPNLIECLKSVAFTIGANATKPELMGVGIRNDGVYSCDGDRMTRAKLMTPAMGCLNIPAKAVEHIVRLGVPDIMFSNQNQVGVYHKNTETVYVSSLYAANFPFDACDRTFKNLSGDHKEVIPPIMHEAISRVTQMADKENSEVIIEGTDQGLRVSCKSEYGKATELVPCAINSRFRIAARPEWFKQALGEAQEVDFSDVMVGNKQGLRFFREGLDHALGLMGIPD